LHHPNIKVIANPDSSSFIQWSRLIAARTRPTTCPFLNPIQGSVAGFEAKFYYIGSIVVLDGGVFTEAETEG